MKLILRDIVDEFIKSISFNELEEYENILEELIAIKQHAKASLITHNEKISSRELSKFKLTLEKINIKFVEIYSTNRETVLSGNFLKISSILKNKNAPKMTYLQIFAMRERIFSTKEQSDQEIEYLQTVIFLLLVTLIQEL